MDKLEQLESRILSADNSDMINEHRSLLESDIAQKLQTVEGLILPLVAQSQKESRERLHPLPNRSVIIDKQIEKPGGD